MTKIISEPDSSGLFFNKNEIKNKPLASFIFAILLVLSLNALRIGLSSSNIIRNRSQKAGAKFRTQETPYGSVTPSFAVRRLTRTPHQVIGTKRHFRRDRIVITSSVGDKDKRILLSLPRERERFHRAVI